ncbi:threonine synthase [Helcobacillus massiliensis]|uniref:threonine synthase n=1 Tax=Helcobacillus TaxID=1161125 RepID=UPI001EF5C4D3|nr:MULTISPECIES: threonine synthase [Helcobacillus]MCG7426825.1 threonine synthase [Helcobacillus sp. ACRRO]MCT1557365.1 threonine synthase [Helcobacillus massiliensis]MCT2036912.1 threonine synthase [Helcobacillus massiliensis]MCT2331650.1 threonine synthase [Helcobacillus massiliensis]MDK7742062.1 threonine synthase [Helcobacillus massiliensis]
MAHQWRGVLREYLDHLPFSEDDALLTLGEGGTPLVHAPTLSDMLGAEVHIKVEGMNPTGSFKDRGMVSAMTKAVNDGAKVVVCASTGNTSASAAAYATRAGIGCAVLLPEGKIAAGKMAQAVMHGARLIAVQGNFDDCLEIARKLDAAFPVELVNSVNPYRLQGQKTGAFEIVDALGKAPDIHVLPVGNAGNISAYWMGYTEYRDKGISGSVPQMWGFQAAGAAPFVAGRPITDPETVATAIRIGAPASWSLAADARDSSGGLISAVSDEEILEAQSLLASEVGIFVEPASAAGVAGLLKIKREGRTATGQERSIPKDSVITVTVTGNGLKDTETALKNKDLTPVTVPVDINAAAKAMGL